MTFLGGTTATQPTPERLLSTVGNYELTSDEVASFLLFWGSYRKLSAARHINRAIKRFMASTSTLDLEDKLVDSIMGFEALFGFSGYRLAHYVSGLMGRTTSERVGIVELMDAAYVARSAITHGGSLESDSNWKTDSQKHVNDVQDYLRRCIKTVLCIGIESRDELRSRAFRIAHDEEARQSLQSSLPLWCFL